MIRDNELKDIGVHLAFTRDGFDVQSPILYRSLSGKAPLTDSTGNLHTNIASLRKCSILDLAEEAELQFSKLLINGIDFTHIDNHMYSLFPSLGLKGYLAVFLAYNRIWDKQTSSGIRLTRTVRYFPGMFEIWSGRKLRPILLAFAFLKKLHPIDYCYAFPFSGKDVPSLQEKKDLFSSFLRELPDGVTELHIHPCIDTLHLRNSNPTWQHRVHEYQMLKEINLKQLLEKYGIELTSYSALCRESSSN